MVREKLSVIIPVYNVERYLRECLDSVVNQTFRNIEIIIVNDNSLDNSEEIILEYQAKDERIKYIKHEKNLGLGGARNTGVKNATSEWVTFVDSDDYIELNCYENMMKLLKNTEQANLGIFSVIKFDDITKEETYDSYYDVSSANDERFPFINVIMCNKLFRREDIVDNGIEFPEHLKHEDEEFWWKYNAVVDVKYVYDSHTYYHYRQRQGSIMQIQDTKLDYVVVMQNLYEFIKLHNLLTIKRKYLIHVYQYLSKWYIHISECNKMIFFTGIKNILNQFVLTKEEFNEFTQEIQFLYLSKSIDDFFYYHSFIKEDIKEDKWYIFGQLSKKEKIKKIVKVILKKLKLYK